MTDTTFASALIEMQPWSRSRNERVTVRIADGPSPGTYGIGKRQWLPAVQDRPAVSMDLSTPRLDSGLRAGRASFNVAVSKLKSVKYSDLYFRSAPVKIWSTKEESLARAAVEFDGRIISVRLNDDRSTMSVTCEVWTSFLDKPLLTEEFSGLGGIEGEIGMRGTLRPAGFGKCDNVPIVFFDQVDMIGQVDGYGNTIAITNLMEGLSDMGAAMRDYATYADLKYAAMSYDIPEGRWATCVAEGLIALGSMGKYPMTANCVFRSDRIGKICQRIITHHAGVDPARITTAAFDALDAAVDRPVHYWTRDQRSVLDLLERLARSANATPLVTLRGQVTITRAVSSAPVGTIDCSGRQVPRVIRTKFREMDAPYWKIKARAARPASVLSIDQVLFSATLVEVGAYKPGETYREGQIVTLPNGSRWLFINPTPQKDSPPQDGNPDWQRLADDITAGTIRYDDGRTVQELQPAEPGADTTGNNTSANTRAVAERLAETVNRLSDINTNSALANSLRQDDLDLILQAMAYIEGQPTQTFVLNLRNESKSATDALIALVQLIGAKNADGTAFVLHADTAQVAPGRTLAQYISEVGSITDDLSLKSTFLMQTITGPDGNEARAVIRVDNNENMAAIVTSAGDVISRIGLIAGQVIIAKPDGTPLTTFGVDGDEVYVPNLKVDKISYGAMDPEFISGMEVVGDQYSIRLPGGRSRVRINDEQTATITFATPFPNMCLSFTPVPAINAPSNFRDLWLQIVGIPDRYGAVVQAQSSTANNNNIDGYDWNAWGY